MRSVAAQGGPGPSTVPPSAGDASDRTMLGERGPVASVGRPPHLLAGLSAAGRSRTSGPPTLAGRSLVSGGGRAPSKGRQPLYGQSALEDGMQQLVDRQHGLGSASGARARLGSSQFKRPPPPPGAQLDFDEEAKKLWSRLNLDPSLISNGPYNALDPLWRHPQSGGTFYVGNQTAAANLDLLEKYRISHVVNCTDRMPLYHEGTGRIKYFRFDITSFSRRVHGDEQAVVFVQPMLDFVANALAEGHNVMAHCLAGAHRAGTTGVICLMNFAQLSAREAVPVAKRCRPIIDPIGDFPELLAKLERGWRTGPRGAGVRSVAPGSARTHTSSN